MKKRTFLGRSGDVRDTTAAACADAHSASRIFDALDWEHDERVRSILERRRKERNRKRRTRLVAKVRKGMGARYADAFRAWLRGQNWVNLGIPRRTFWDRVKKVKIFLNA